MAGKKGQAPAGLEGSQGPESGADAVTAPETEPTKQADAVPTEEERIRQAAQRQLEQRAGEAVVKLQQAESRAEALQGELDRSRQALQAAEQQIAELKVALAEATSAAKNAGTAIDGLPSNARQLNECVTIASGVTGVGKGGRLHAKAGDVLIVTKDEDEWADLQKQLGLRATVYRVSRDTLEDLEKNGFLHK